MEQVVVNIFNSVAKIFGYFYDEWGWSGVAFLLFWGVIGLGFLAISTYYWVAEKFSAAGKRFGKKADSKEPASRSRSK